MQKRKLFWNTFWVRTLISVLFFFTETKLKRGLKLKVLGSNPDVGMNEIVELEGSFLVKRVTLGVFSWPGF